MIASRVRERGAALIVLLAILVIGASWFIVSRVANLSFTHTASERQHNAEVLSRAKQALIGYVASQAAQITERNPGRFPCPEPSQWVNVVDAEGIAAPGIQGGISASACSNIGRLPWRTLGLDKLVDAHGEPLWYVVGPSWRLTSSTTSLTINSNGPSGDLTVDGQPNAAIAMIIAPGTPMNVQAGAGCTARNQLARAAPSSTIDALDYIECFDLATRSFSTTGASTSFNDQAVVITVADVMPAIEAAIADRIARQIVPALKTAYAAPEWGLSGTGVLYPFAAPFVDPSTSAMQGTISNYRGLLPMSYSETSPGSGVPCTAGATAPRCAPSFVAWTGTPTLSGSSVYAPDCGASTATQISCTFYYRCFLLACGAPASVPFTLNGTAAHVGMALRQVNADTSMTNVETVGRSATATMNADGSANVTLSGTATASGSGGLLSNLLCGITGLLGLVLGCKQTSIAVPINLFADHPLANPADATYGWFTRNKWHEVVYYAVAPSYSPAGAPAPSCVDNSTCLTISNLTPTGKQRAILILAGRSINGSVRPSSTLSDYLEFGNATARWERQAVTGLLPALFADTGAANAYSVAAPAMSAGSILQFRAANANTGASTLTTPANGTRNLTNPDGSALTASQLNANAAIQVFYDGVAFIMEKRPFNDRIIVVDSNP